MRELFLHIFNKYKEKDLKHLVFFYNSEFKQQLLTRDMIFLLNMSCFYNEEVANLCSKLTQKYLATFPFILNDYQMFEYYADILGLLIKNISGPYKCLIEKIQVQQNYVIELPTEKEKMKQTLNYLSSIFEKGLQKSYIINNENISYNLANFISKFNLIEDQEHSFKYSINIVQKIYNNIKKIEVPGLLKTTAYLEPKKFEDYLKKNVYLQFDKYLSISDIQEISNFSDFAKSCSIQMRNKFIGVIEGKIINLKYNFKSDERLKKKLKEMRANESVNDYCYFKIIKEYNEKILRVIRKKEITKYDLFSILVELTSFYIYTEMDKDFETSFKKKVIFEDICYKITLLPFLIGTSDAFEAGVFCWDWILYFNTQKMEILLNMLQNSIVMFNNIVASKRVFEKNYKVHNDLFVVSKPFEAIKHTKVEEFTESLKKSYYSNITHDEFNLTNTLFVFPKFNTKINDENYIQGQILVLKFLKECLNVII